MNQPRFHGSWWLLGFGPPLLSLVLVESTQAMWNPTGLCCLVWDETSRSVQIRATSEPAASVNLEYLMLTLKASKPGGDLNNLRVCMISCSLPQCGRLSGVIFFCWGDCHWHVILWPNEAIERTEPHFWSRWCKCLLSPKTIINLCAPLYPSPLIHRISWNGVPGALPCMSRAALLLLPGSPFFLINTLDPTRCSLTWISVANEVTS